MFKKKVIFLLTVLAMFAPVFCLPIYITGKAAEVYLVRAESKPICNTTLCQGTIIAGKTSEIYITSPIIAGDVAVKVGDEVSEGDILCTVNVPATDAVLSTSLAGQEMNISNTATEKLSNKELFGVEGIDIEELARAYSDAEHVTSERSVFYSPQYISPISGTVTDVKISENAFFISSEPAVIISDLSKRIVKAQVKQRDMDNVFLGDRAKITAVGLGEIVGEGIVVDISPVAKRVIIGTAVEAVVDVEIVLDEVNDVFKPNYIVDVVIEHSVNEKAFTVPFEIIKQDKLNNEYIMVLGSDCRPQKRCVDTGNEYADSTEILRGLENGEFILLSQSKITENQLISIKGEKHFE